MPRHSILFVDAYDSFSNSIIALLEAELPVSVESIKIDDPRFVLNDDAFFNFLDGFDAVVAGPGPGHPANPEDIGLINKLWTLPDQHLLPVLGICLGFQSLCLAFGGSVERLKQPRHGIMAILTHSGKDIFVGTGKLVATQYHSLHVRLQSVVGPGWDFWQPSDQCESLVPLAWDLMNVSNGPTLMAVRHAQKPFWGVQYHPESICTNKEGQKAIGKWWKHASAWKSQPSRGNRASLLHVDGLQQSEIRMLSSSTNKVEEPIRQVHWLEFKAYTSPDVAFVAEVLRDDSCSEPLVLESGTRHGKAVNPETGRFSIIGLPDASSTHIRYSTASGVLDVTSKGKTVLEKHVTAEQALSYADEFVLNNKASGGLDTLPFWGGLVGFISYEAGLETIKVAPSGATPEHSDISFIFAERSVIIDNKEAKIYVQSLRDHDEGWLHLIAERLQQSLANHDEAEKTSIDGKICAQVVSEPQKNEYCRKVLECQAHLRAGESYELCLTDQSLLKTAVDGWSMYRRLRSRNPAPFSAYLRLQSRQGPGLTVVGSSPERFLSWSRDGKCQFRPIKGTVKKSPGVTRAKAEEVLGSAKERAENLMIVDLIRHDLSGVKGVANVSVPKLMSIEEYETVFQLVSVIEGDLEPAASGVAVLAASLPPGSMTGAPKKRSCELLKDLEGGKPRGLYSGVIGFLDVGGGGDFSVVIRTAFKWDDEGDVWRVGAGGAITALSDAEAEWEEMMTKRESVFNSLL
ncbi:related to para-aminobenzoic acid synthetase [Ramularia collo-cygni]|uniref:aminodeoxychorismate synthase n=1 Tax=Ramularia collo-cygni TaxID=112498 RepID=A0A2D3VEW8_9PEZI|nr:related to para-aminobenzoic acid synthetase [Ramularia collo-cygni]CZT23642.1 related to para-aminobenzoic acid synthetase [Ramularia collo-cygni]